jgi:hypothetical protein
LTPLFWGITSPGLLAFGPITFKIANQRQKLIIS